ncbi:MAG TPA: GNAT family N-acetyltransferase [Pseudomonadales bacterium]
MVACFRRCYGDTYPSDDFYDSERLRQRIESGSLRSVVAIGDDGVLVGHTGLTVRHAGAKAIEAGNTVVDPAARGQGLLGQMAAALTDLCLAHGYVGYVHYPTTAHEIMQKASVRGGGVETGVMLDYIPAETEYRAIDQGVGALAATVVYQPFTPAPARDVWLPRDYLELAQELYGSARLVRTPQPANDRLKAHDTRAQRSFNARRGLLNVHVTAAGEDLERAIEAAPSDGAIRITHVDLCMDDPGLGGAVELLRRRGFFFCALLPEFAHTDVLRMQRLTHPTPTSYAPRLANLGARRLLEWMRTESG